MHDLNDWKQSIPSRERGKVILLGGSIVEHSFSIETGWGAALSNWFGRTADVINRGFSGYNSRWIKIILPRIFPQHDPTIMLTIIFLGSNDSSDGSQCVPLQEFQSNLVEIVNYLRSAVNERMKILFITPAIVDDTKWFDRNPQRTLQYAQAVILATDELNYGHRRKPPAAVVSLWKPSAYNLPSDVKVHRLETGALEEMTLTDLQDGLHFNRVGSGKLFRNITKVIIEKFPHLVPNYIYEEFYGEGMEENGKEENDLANFAGINDHYPHFFDLINLTLTQLSEAFEKWQWHEKS